MSKVWVDPPSGWKYGFPKIWEKESEDEDMYEWLVKEGYPAVMIVELGKHFFVRMWEAKDE